MKNIRLIIQILLVVVVGFLAYKLYDSINQPIRFNKEKEVRYKAVIQNLKDITEAQVAYKSVNGFYSDNLDSLIQFVKIDSLPLIRKVGSLPDSLNEDMARDLGLIIGAPVNMTEEEALDKGFFIRDTVTVLVLDSLFDNSYPIDSLKYVPFSDNKQFVMKSGVVETGSGVRVQVFEASATNKIILNDMDNQLRINLDDQADRMNKFHGLKVGSLEEATNNAGNWE